MPDNSNCLAENGSNTDPSRPARESNVEAFAELFNSNRAKVYALCLRMTGNPAESEDLAQEAFLQAFRKLDSFRGASALSTWLYRVAINTVLMHFRTQGRRRRSRDQPASAGTGNLEREYGDVDKVLTSSVDRIALSRAMKQLPVGCRTIFTLYEIEGYGHQEIARIQSCTVGNSKSQLHRAKTKLRELLGFRNACPAGAVIQNALPRRDFLAPGAS